MKSSKPQAPRSREASNPSHQMAAAPVLGLGISNFSGRWMLDVGAFFACAACYGASDSPMAKGMNWGIFSLLGVVAVVLGSIATFFVFIGKKSAAASAEQDAASVPESTQKT